MPHRNDPRPVFDTRMMLHLQLTLILAWLGFILLLPGDTFETTPAWAYFKAAASETEWGFLFVCAAGVGGIGIDTSRRWLKLLSILFLATVHGALAISFLRGNPLGGGAGTFAIVAASGYYLAWRQTWGMG